MKKFNSILAIAAIAVSSVFGLTSCDKENDSYNEVINPRPKTETVTVPEQTSEVQKYNYDANGMWRFESNGKKYTLYVDVPDREKGGFYSVNFYFDGQNIAGDVNIEGDVMTFKSNSNQKTNVFIKAKFANNDSQKFTAEEITIDNTTVATNATFNKIDTPTAYQFKVTYAVVDPDNQLPSMGIDIQTLNNDIKKFGNIIQTEDLNPLKAVISMSFQKAGTDILVSTEMIGQCKTYPELAKSNVYVQTTITESFGDVTVNLGANPYTYTQMGK